MQCKAGVTAAGPLPIFTGFPIKHTHLNVPLIYNMALSVKVIVYPGSIQKNIDNPFRIIYQNCKKLIVTLYGTLRGLKGKPV